MKRIMNYIKSNKMFVGIMSISILTLCIGIVSLVKSTYSVSDKYVVFKGVGQHDEEIIKSCKIGTDGKLDGTCVDQIGRICSQWSKQKCPGSWVDGVCNQTCYGTSPSTLKTMTFSDSDTYYCVGCTSNGTSYFWGCYVCDGNSSVMQWVVNVQPSDSRCTTTWHKDNSINDDKQCVPPATLTPTNTVTPTVTVTVTPTKKPTAACYECKDDKNIMKWDTNGDVDSKCPSGYNRTDKAAAQCVPDNPDTGLFAIIIAWIVGLIAIGYSAWYFRKVLTLK